MSVQETGEVNGPVPFHEPSQSTVPSVEVMFCRSFPAGDVTVNVVSLIVVFDITVGAVISISGGNLIITSETFQALS